MPLHSSPTFNLSTSLAMAVVVFTLQGVGGFSTWANTTLAPVTLDHGVRSQQSAGHTMNSPSRHTGTEESRSLINLQNRQPKIFSVSKSLQQLENQLYGRSMQQGQSTDKRLGRIERTLFGDTQPGNTQQRITRLQQAISVRRAQHTTNTQVVVLRYLEEKYYQQTFDQLPFEKRLSKLEATLFGEIRPGSLGKRMDYLVAHSPLATTEVRVVSKLGYGVASSKPQTSQKGGNSSPPRPANEEELSAGDVSEFALDDVVVLEVSKQQKRAHTAQKEPKAVPLHHPNYGDKPNPLVFKPQSTPGGIQVRPQFVAAPSPTRAIHRPAYDIPRLPLFRLVEIRRDGDPEVAPTPTKTDPAQHHSHTQTHGHTHNSAYRYSYSQNNPTHAVPPVNRGNLSSSATSEQSNARPLPAFSGNPAAAPATERPMEEEGTSLLASHLTPPVPTSSIPLPNVSSSSASPGPSLPQGHYLDFIFRSNSGTFLRWPETTLKYFVRASRPDQLALSQRAAQSWAPVVQLKEVNDPNTADLVIDWTLAYGQLKTQPVLILDPSNEIRNTVFISMEPYTTLSAEQQEQSLTHQLGHGLGLWGHSPDPEDVMYPHHPYDQWDFPNRWQLPKGQDQHFSSATASSSGQSRIIHPSSQDFATLQLLYSKNSANLRHLHTH